MPDRADVRRAGEDVAVFAALVGSPLTGVQSAAMRLESRTTVLVAPRQTGKSRSLAVLALWWAFRRRGQVVLIVSAGEAAASRLLGQVRRVAAHPLLAGSVLDESGSVLTLSNGSTIRSVPASERQVRGESVDLLVVDEAAFVTESLLSGAAIPTTAARPDARIVLASSPWSDSGPFYDLAVAGGVPSPLLRTVRWSLADAPWVSGAAVESARLTMSEPRFRAEFLGEFVGGADRFLPLADLRAATVPYRLPGWAPGCVLGLDWGRAFDGHAIVAAGVLADYGASREPVVFLPFVETSRRPYAAQVGQVVTVARRLGSRLVVSESNGVGQMPSETLGERLRGWARVEPVASSQRSKEDAYGRLRALLVSGRLVLPDVPELLRQLGGIVAEASPSGGLSLRAVTAALHDDLPDALSLAVSRVVLRRAGRGRVPDGVEWLESGHGTRVPAAPGCSPPVGGSGRARGRIPTGAAAAAGRSTRPVQHSDGSWGAMPTVGGRK